jgi:hypothetical protein
LRYVAGEAGPNVVVSPSFSSSITKMCRIAPGRSAARTHVVAVTAVEVAAVAAVAAPVPGATVDGVAERAGWNERAGDQRTRDYRAANTALDGVVH